MSADLLLEEVETLVSQNGPAEERLLAILDRALAHFDCKVGTIHSLDAAAKQLRIRAQRGMPEALMERVSLIPVGKGMAGLAAERMEPVQVCNLQSDESGQAKPGAKLTQMEGSIAFPIIRDRTLRGTMGLAKPVAYEFTKDEIALMMRLGGKIGRMLR